jgi:cytochrome c biogenesis protein CcmG/thiol:disulfide interchange protein DsbE
VVDLARRHPVAIVGLNYKDTRPAATQWLANLGNPYRATVFDGDGRVGIDFGVYGVPETFVIDREGVVRLKHIGPLTVDVVRDRIDPLLKELNGKG